MKKAIFTIIFFLLLLTQVFQAQAQTKSNFDMTNFPQWAKDVRRFDIIAFGAFPFSWFFITFIYDMYRWKDANNFDFSADGRRYAPWPLKSAGAVDMTNDEYKRTLLTAAGLSVAIAVTDLIIVYIKRSRQRRRTESRSAGSVIINKMTYGSEDDPPEDAGDTDDLISPADEPDNSE